MMNSFLSYIDFRVGEKSLNVCRDCRCFCVLYLTFSCGIRDLFA